MASIKINNKDYTIKFDYSSIRKFGKQVGLNKPSELENIFNNMDLEDPTFDDIDNIAHLLRSGIKHVKIPSFDDVLTSLTSDPEGIAKVFEEFNSANSIDVTEEEVLNVEDPKN
tara:strand:+ start:16472 stop:16813 length:342 start_codon:yes stop_codon:yes gene_type:complete